MTDDHPLDVFNEFSPLYRYRINPSGFRVLSQPEPDDHEARERALVDFQPAAERALKIAAKHDVKLRLIHRRWHGSGASLIDHIIAEPIRG